VVFLAAFWDFLREPVNMIAGLSMPVNVLLFIVALVLLGVSLLAWKKNKSKRLLLVTISFGLFFVKALLSLLDYFVSPGIFMNYAIQGFFDLVILVFLFVALFRK